MKKKKFFNYVVILCFCMFLFGKLVYADDNNFTQCNSMGKLKDDLQQLFNLFKIIVPLLVIGFSTVDFVKAIGGKNERDLKKATSKFFKRIVLGIVFFFLPSIINLFLDIFMIDSSTCIN